MSNDFNLPVSWLQLKLGDVISYGKAERAEPGNIPQDAWVLELEDIEKDTSRLLQRLTFAQRQSKSTKNRFSAGDVLYGKLRPNLNKVIKADQDGFCTTEILPLQPNQAIHGGYLFYWLRHPKFLEYVVSVSHGLNMPRLGTEAGLQAPLVLAPIAEQQRIADKLDVLLARVDACRARLDRVPFILKRFRQAVLTAATSGRLTEEWRGEAATSEWAFERAEAVCEKVQSGGTPKEGFIERAGVPFLKVYNIVDQKVDFDNRPQFVDVGVHIGPLSKSIAKPGDVLMNIVGPPLGKVAIVPDAFPEWNINQAITLFRPSERITTEWLYYFLCSGRSVAGIAHQTRGSAGQSNISLSQCRDFSLPVPPLQEQHEIVRRVEALFVYADRLEARYQAGRTQVERLTPALLAKAFRGELVPQDPNDEPAAVLLERIRTARTAQPAKAKVSGSSRQGASVEWHRQADLEPQAFFDEVFGLASTTEASGEH